MKQLSGLEAIDTGGEMAGRVQEKPGKFKKVLAE
jgi:hypothetical protein